MSPPRARVCVTCGKQFTGRDRKCYGCTATDRSCIVCGRIFHDVKRTCQQCRATERICVVCGRSFRGNWKMCPSCTPVQRTCACGKQYRGTALICRQCSAAERECSVCHQTFTEGGHTVCRSCRVTTRQCTACGRAFRGDQLECASCRTTVRQCITCGSTFRSPFYLQCGTCSGRTFRVNERRRLRKLAAQINGPLPTRTYARILASGPCVYCGALADSIDHVRPLSRGGQETEANLVPACMGCNLSKNATLLIHWNPVRVAHGVAHSPIVAAELDRERIAMFPVRPIGYSAEFARPH